MVFAPHKGTHYLDFLASVVSLGADRYLEIGTFNGGSLSRINCAAIAIDPQFRLDKSEFSIVGKKPACLLFQMESDRFFERYNPSNILGGPLDIAFLDGMHRYEYLLRDLINTERHCHRGSTVFLHDCLPTDYATTSRKPVHGTWAGDVWKVLPALRKYRPDLVFNYFDCPPTGLVSITNLDPSSNTLYDNYFNIVHDTTEEEDRAALSELSKDIVVRNSKLISNHEAMSILFINGK